MSYSIAAIANQSNKQKVILARLQKRNNPGYQRGLAFWGAFDAASGIAREYYMWQLAGNQEIEKVCVGTTVEAIINELIKIIGEKS